MEFRDARSPLRQTFLCKDRLALATDGGGRRSHNPTSANNDACGPTFEHGFATETPAFAPPFLSLLHDGHNMDHYADDLAAVAAQLDLINAIHVGHSTGSGEVVHYLARHGESRVSKAAIISAGGISLGGCQPNRVQAKPP